jgi:hypothetical protein
MLTVRLTVPVVEVPAVEVPVVEVLEESAAVEVELALSDSPPW